ncbi:MAG TPA: hypothetical protein VJH63_03935 [Candidatus Paceibacterota bacterium]
MKDLPRTKRDHSERIFWIPCIYFFDQTEKHARKAIHMPEDSGMKMYWSLCLLKINMFFAVKMFIMFGKCKQLILGTEIIHPDAHKDNPPDFNPDDDYSLDEFGSYIAYLNYKLLKVGKVLYGFS